MGRIWKEIFMARFEVQLMHLPGGTEEGHEERGLYEMWSSHLAVPVASLTAWISLLGLGFSYRVQALSDWAQALSDWAQALADWVQALSDWAQALSDWAQALSDWVQAISDWAQALSDWAQALLDLRQLQSTQFQNYAIFKNVNKPKW
jgi:predicted PurR-regulated permease PerM